ncbi:hypothetical protein K437DRAFT_254527 [Tilletiaria anomala UBC 951]|uniref:WD40 repeat-like protein n=1 Tax=Tilletiaria anomala (strain ATCC 24038 / CBS 436.72 / UBC 951) TaxID=1037660 RepID=A0A066WEF3_TILAU|nr:uncharacterized protein K437DRAFT_254527 [Tilletiaria anomala UBC 951]KDN52151.1 hypothetical protein K437DRAFT_254527 [Tilletiaria anomala UBC 951]
MSQQVSYDGRSGLQDSSLQPVADENAIKNNEPSQPVPPPYHFDLGRRPPTCLACTPSPNAARVVDTRPRRDIYPNKKCRGTERHAQAPRRCVFWRRARWSPDGGSHILTQSEDHRIEIFKVVNTSAALRNLKCETLVNGKGDKSNPKAEGVSEVGHALQLERTLEWIAPSPIVEGAWYPYAAYAPLQENQPQHASHPWLFIVSCRDTPIKLVDAHTGKTRSSYSLESHIETLLSAHTLAFSLYPSMTSSEHPPQLVMYAGLSSTAQLGLFNLAESEGINRAGRVSLGLKAGHSAAKALAATRQEHAAHDRAVKRRKRNQSITCNAVGGSIGQRGIISCFDIAFDCASVERGGDDPSAKAGEEILAIATLDGGIGLYSTAALRYLAAADGAAWDPHKMETLAGIGLNACLSGWRAGLPSASNADDDDYNHGVQGDGEEDAAASQILFHPTIPYLLFVAQRRHKGRIIVYDTRYLPRRKHSTGSFDNQGLSFDEVDFERTASAQCIAAVLMTGRVERSASPSPVAAAAAAARSSTRTARPNNQRVFFDVDWAGRWLVSGGPPPASLIDGKQEEGEGGGWVHVWNISEDALLSGPSGPNKSEATQGKDWFKLPQYSFHSHEDVVTSCVLHPYYPMLLTTAGSRRALFEAQQLVDDEEESDSDESGSGEPSGLSSPSSSPSSLSATSTSSPTMSAPSDEGGDASPTAATAPASNLMWDASMKLWDLRRG